VTRAVQPDAAGGTSQKDKRHWHGLSLQVTQHRVEPGDLQVAESLHIKEYIHYMMMPKPLRAASMRSQLDVSPCASNILTPFNPASSANAPLSRIDSGSSYVIN